MATSTPPTPTSPTPQGDSTPAENGRFLWLWPVLVLIVLVIAGQFWGPYGALMSGVLALAVITLSVGRKVLATPALLGVLIASALALTAITAARTLGVRQFGTEPIPPSFGPSPTQPTVDSTPSPTP